MIANNGMLLHKRNNEKFLNIFIVQQETIG